MSDSDIISDSSYDSSNESRIVQRKEVNEMLTSTPSVATSSVERFDVELSTAGSTVNSISNISLSTLSGPISEDASSLFTVNVNKIKKFPLKGNDYLLFQPKSKSSLYSKLIKSFNNLDSLIHGWMIYYEKHRTEAVEVLIQLFLDVMGFQKIIFNITKDVDYEQFLIRLQKKPIKAHINFQCVLKSKSMFGNVFCKVFYTFLHRMVLGWYANNIIPDDQLVDNHILKFLTVMMTSRWRVTVFTSCIIALKLCTSFIFVKQDVHNNLQSSENPSSDVLDHIEIGKLKSLDKYVAKFMALIKKYCFLADTTFYPLRVMFANECTEWFKTNPEHYITEENLNILRKLIIDEKKNVRIAALSASEYLLRLKKHQPFMSKFKKRVKQLIDTVANRLIDVDIHVKEAAIKCLSRCIVNYPDAVSDKTEVLIVKNMFSKHFNLANEAGKFCSEILREGDDHVRTIHNVIIIDKYQELQNLVGHTALLVEALIQHLNELSSLGLILSLTISKEVKFSQEEVMKLLEIAFHVTNIMVKGTSYTGRMPILKNIDYVKGNQMCADVWIPLGEDLLRHFHMDNIATLWIVKSLNLLNFEQISIIYFKSQIFRIINLLGDIIMSSEDYEVLKQIAILYGKFRKDNILFKAEFIASFELLLDNIIKEYETCLTKLLSLQIGETNIRNVTYNIYLLSILFEYHPTSSAKWNLLCMNWLNSSLNNKIISYQMTCSRFYLKWQMAIIINKYPNINNNQLSSWRSKAKEFLDACLLVFNNSKNDALIKFTHVAICDFFIQWAEAKRDNLAISVLALNEPFVDIKIYEQTLIDLREFVVKKCFLEVTDSLQRRRGFIFKFLELTCLKVVRTEELFYVFNYYPMDDYGDIFKFVLTKTDKLGFLFGMLTHSYEKAEELASTQALAFEFVPLVQGKMIAQFLRNAVNYISENNNNAGFLDFMVPFVSKATLIVRRNTLIDVKNKLPEHCLEMKPVKLFVAVLSSMTKGQNPLDCTSINATSTTNVTSITVPESNSDEDYSIVDMEEER